MSDQVATLQLTKKQYPKPLTGPFRCLSLIHARTQFKEWVLAMLEGTPSSAWLRSRCASLNQNRVMALNGISEGGSGKQSNIQAL
jgi:hypothetical protein